MMHGNDFPAQRGALPPLSPSLCSTLTELGAAALPLFQTAEDLPLIDEAVEGVSIESLPLWGSAMGVESCLSGVNSSEG